MPALARHSGDLLRGARPNWRAVDWVTAVLLTVGGLLALKASADQGLVLLAGASSVACTGSVAARRQAPVIATFVAITGMVAYQQFSNDQNLAFQPFAVALTFYTVGANSDDRTSRTKLGALFVYALVGCALISANSGGFSIVNVLMDGLPFTLLPAVAGLVVARRAKLTRQLSMTASQLRLEQSLQVSRAALEERNRVARELHDVLAHCVSVMVIQAAAARRNLALDRDAARAAIGVVGTAGREAMGDLRRLMGILHRSDDSVASAAVGFAHLNALVKRVCDGGLPTTLVVRGDPVDLPADLDLAVYRIVQEALTNVVKHAGPATAQVRVTFSASTIELEISDTGSGSARSSLDGPGTGHGLVGMRERVALHGGEISTGPGSRGGYLVRAVLPVGVSTAVPTLSRSLPTVDLAPPAALWWRPSFVDAAFAGVVLIALEVEALTSDGAQSTRALSATVVALMALAWLLRGRAPLLFLTVVIALAVPLSGGLTSPHAVTLTGTYVLIVPLLTVAVFANRAHTAVAAAIVLAYAAGVELVEHAPVVNVISGALVVAGVCAVGRIIHAQRRLAQEIREATNKLTLEREERQREAVASERAFIARDLQGLVARGVVTMVIQAEVAAEAADIDPAAARRALESIEAAGRDVLVQMRHILGILRSGASNDRQPQPGIDQLAALIVATRASGQSVELKVEGIRPQLHRGADLTTYRIIEEILTGPDRAVAEPIVIALRYQPCDLELDIVTPRRDAPQWPSHSICERVATCDGEVLVSTGTANERRLVVRIPHAPATVLR